MPILEPAHDVKTTWILRLLTETSLKSVTKTGYDESDYTGS